MICNIVSTLYPVVLFSWYYNVAGLQYENIVGGEIASKKQFGFVVSLQRGSYHYCGGTLIAPNLMLTAAHCFHNEETSRFENYPWMVVAGLMNVNMTNDFRKIIILVQEVYLHRNYVPGGLFTPPCDIAIARLIKSFDVSDTSPISLVSLVRSGEDHIGHLATFIGFGSDKANMRLDERTGEMSEEASAPKHLKYGRVLIESWIRNMGMLYFFGRMVQKSRTPEGVCVGDSGGPLVIRVGTQSKVVGILSSGPVGCDESLIPGVYTTHLRTTSPSLGM